MKFLTALLLLAANAWVANGQNYPLVQATVFITERNAAAVRANGLKFWMNKPSQGSNIIYSTIPIENIRTLFFTPANKTLRLASEDPIEGQQCYVSSDGAFSFLKGAGKLPAGAIANHFIVDMTGGLFVKNGTTTLEAYVCTAKNADYEQIFWFDPKKEKRPFCREAAIGLVEALGAGRYQ